jgi:hypothetical protein
MVVFALLEPGPGHLFAAENPNISLMRRADLGTGRQKYPLEAPNCALSYDFSGI